jgi:hypothetical protein
VEGALMTERDDTNRRKLLGDKEMRQRPRTPQHSIVVWCRHGIDDGKADFVQRYRYTVNTMLWSASDHGAEGSTTVTDQGDVRDSSNAPPMFDENENVLDYREHFNARCKQCHRLVPMRADRAQVALTRLADLGLKDVPLAALQRAYDEVPATHR